MKTNSELPLCLLGQNNDLNQYDFVLFHLYISNKDYRNYYRNQRTLFPGRLMILDNSAYEFFVKGEELDLEKYFDVICELKPDMYILPDVLMNKEKTLRGVECFMEKYGMKILEKSPYSKPLAVAQGNSELDLLSCLSQFIHWGLTRVAIPFHNRFFKEMGMTVDADIQKKFLEWHDTDFVTDDMLYAMGRVKFVNRNREDIEPFNHIHLLGSHDPFEKTFYDWVDTMDTGYPVKCAIAGYEFGKEPHKPEVIIDEFLDKDLDKECKKLIKNNVRIFRDL